MWLAVRVCSQGSVLMERGWGVKAETNSYYQGRESIILLRVIITYDNHFLPSNNHLSCASVSNDPALLSHEGALRREREREELYSYSVS